MQNQTSPIQPDNATPQDTTEEESPIVLDETQDSNEETQDSNEETQDSNEETQDSNEDSLESNEETPQAGGSDQDLDAGQPDNGEQVVQADQSDEIVEADEDESEDDADFRGILEALIFASDEPLTFKQIKELLAPNESEADESTEAQPGRGRRRKTRSLTITRVKRALDRLNEEFAGTGRAFRIVEVAGGFAFQTTADYGAWVGRLFAERSRRRLTQSALETLAIIAFKQPISKPAIEGIRGVNAEYVVKSLLERNLISIVGREDSPGRPLLYGTTKNFLKHFGLSSINELPKPREIKDLLSSEEELAVNPIEEMDPDQASKLVRVSSQELERLFDTARLKDDAAADAPVLRVQFDTGEETDVVDDETSPDADDADPEETDVVDDETSPDADEEDPDEIDVVDVEPENVPDEEYSNETDVVDVEPENVADDEDPNETDIVDVEPEYVAEGPDAFDEEINDESDEDIDVDDGIDDNDEKEL